MPYCALSHANPGLISAVIGTITVVGHVQGAAPEPGPAERAIAATRRLAEEGGYEAVQIRDVVRLTGLSSATIYRYFSSKDQLIAAAHLDFVRQLRADGTGDSDAESAAERVAEFLHRTCEALARSPKLGQAFVLALGSTDPGVRGLRQEQDAVVNEIVKAAIEGEPVDADEFVVLLGLAWQGALYSWAHGELSIEEIDALLQRVARVLLAGVVDVTALSDVQVR
jgi:TetR/AcrR family transcriptional regulator, cholesterol catabolism regulator